MMTDQNQRIGFLLPNDFVINKLPTDIKLSTDIEEPEQFDFGIAIQRLKAGHNITRKGWNNKRVFLYLIKGNEISRGMGYGYGEYLNEPSFQRVIFIHTADNELYAWSPSQEDILADDWM
jgi:hypothetical protein